MYLSRLIINVTLYNQNYSIKISMLSNCYLHINNYSKNRQAYCVFLKLSKTFGYVPALPEEKRFEQSSKTTQIS